MASFSRFVNAESRNARKSALLYTGLTISLILLMSTFGVAMLSKISSVFSPKTDNVFTQTDRVPPPPPNFVNLPNFTNQKNLPVKGSTEPNSTVKLTVNGASQEIYGSATGNFDALVSLKEGENTLSAEAVDQNNNVSRESQKYIIFLDSKPPTILITSPENDLSLTGKKNKEVVITGSVDEESEITINGRFAMLSDDLTFSQTFSLVEGENNIEIVAKDKASNETKETRRVNFTP